MDTYAVAGLKPEQIHFLYAPTHLNPTYGYGVSLNAERMSITVTGVKCLFLVRQVSTIKEKWYTPETSAGRRNGCGKM